MTSGEDGLGTGRLGVLGVGHMGRAAANDSIINTHLPVSNGGRDQ